MDNGTVAGMRWKASKAEMLLSFDQEDLNTLYSLFRTSDKYTKGVNGASVNQIVSLLDAGFAELVHHEIIEPRRIFSTEGRRQFDSILSAFPAEEA